MPKYNSVFVPEHDRRKSKKGLKIFLGIIIAIILILAVLFALNFKTIMLALGKGSIKIKSPQEIKKSMTNSENFKNISDKTDSAGSDTVTGVTKDGAITYTITQQKDGKETVSAQVDLKKLDTGGISKSAVLHGNISAVGQAKSLADKYLEPIVGKDQASGLEAYIANEALKQSKSNPNSININHNFGNTAVQVTGDLSAHKAAVKITQ